MDEKNATKDEKGDVSNLDLWMVRYFCVYLCIAVVIQILLFTVAVFFFFGIPRAVYRYYWAYPFYFPPTFVVPCGRFNWLVSFWAYVKIASRIV